jgi:hypothetical protein
MKHYVQHNVSFDEKQADNVNMKFIEKFLLVAFLANHIK